MTAEEFEISFYKAMAKWVDSGRVGPDPRGEWEYLSPKPPEGLEWCSNGFSRTPPFNTTGEFRWKPAKKRTVTIDGMELVAPEVNEPAVGTTYFYETLAGGLVSDVWGGYRGEQAMLKKGKVFLAKEDCQAMADVQRKQRIGGTK